MPRKPNSSPRAGRAEAEDLYANPLISRYASREMAALFGERRKAVAWRRIWVALAESERELGLPITAAQVADLKRFVETPDLAAVARHEAKLRHDVMAHVRAYGEQARSAAGILHLGATSCDVTDNADLVLFREALVLTARRLAAAAKALAAFARRWRKLPCLGLTHFQAAQPTTVGKRAALWLQDLLFDLGEIERLARELPFRGLKGATGTQASFLALFGGDARKVKRLEAGIARRMGFARVVPITGQTYPRKLDQVLLGALAGVFASAHKFATDVRLLSGLGELAEPFGESQVGSSAMPYKRNPMKCERICSLARHGLALASAPGVTAALQWLERTLDDSAGRRLQVPEAFLAADAVLLLVEEVASGLEVRERAVARRLADELPFLATEEILLAATAAGGDRQALHEAIRRHALDVRRRIAEEGAENDLLARLAADPAFAKVKARFPRLAEARRHVGRASEQVEEFLRDVAAPVLARYPVGRERAERPEV